MAGSSFGDDTLMRLRRRLHWTRLVLPQAVAVRHLRGATEYRGTRDDLVASGVHPEWLPVERIAGIRTRATLRARDGGRDVFARRLDDGRYCVLVIQTPHERAMHERMAFERFMYRVLSRG